jgi:predicted transcriptional regulator
MRLGSVVRISEDRNKVPKQFERRREHGATQDLLAKLIDQNPGCDAHFLAAKIGYKSEGTTHATINKLVAKGLVKKRRQDGRMRFYPASARFADERMKEEAEATNTYKPLEGVKAALKTAEKRDLNITQLAKDFVWDTGSHDIREFVKWVEARES